MNPGGTASYGWVILREKKIVEEGSGIVGEGEGMTNNIAEYTGLIEGVKAFLRRGEKAQLVIRGDSNLVVSMVAKKWGWNKKKTKWVPHDDTPHLKVLLDEALSLLEGIDYKIEWVPREKNQEADRLSKKPLVEKGIVQMEHDIRPCKVCGNVLVRRKGKFGEFYGCKNYPKCNFTEKVQ